MSPQITIEYFAMLREQAQKDSEEWIDAPDSITEVYSQLKSKYQFTLDQTQLRVAVNNEFVEWNHKLHQNDKVTFIPPVAGG